MNPTTTTTTSAPRLRALYRSLLRELPPRPVLTSRTGVQARLRETFSAAPPSASAPAASAQQAEQLVQYLRAQRQYATLLERYNPGMGMDEEERVRLTARRVGMDLPVEYETDGETKK